MRQSTLLPVVSCLVAALLFGASTPVAKALLSSVGPFTLAGLLYLGAALAVIPGSFRGGSAALRRDKRQRRLLGLAVVFGGGIGPVLLLFGLRAAPAASVSLWLNAETAATTLLAWALFHEHLDRRTWIAAGFVLCGGLLLAAPEGVAGLKAGGLVKRCSTPTATGTTTDITATSTSGYRPGCVTPIRTSTSP